MSPNGVFCVGGPRLFVKKPSLDLGQTNAAAFYDADKQEGITNDLELSELDGDRIYFYPENNSRNPDWPIHSLNSETLATDTLACGRRSIAGLTFDAKYLYWIETKRDDPAQDGIYRLAKAVTPPCWCPPMGRNPNG